MTHSLPSGRESFGGDLPHALRDAFLSAHYTAEGVSDVLGSVASAALGRGERVPGLRATAEGSPLDVLIRLFLLQASMPAAAVAGVVPVQACVSAGVLADAGSGNVRAAIDIRPYGGDDTDAPWWVASDLGRDFAGKVVDVAGDSGSGPGGASLGMNHVLGVGGASTTLAQLVLRAPVERSLDLGTGCGVQALHLSRHSTSVVATDVLSRALAFARLTARLSGVPDEQLQLRQGSLYKPVQRERFDLVVANPPFVVHPDGSGGGYTYRDSGLPGDEVCARLVSRAADHLTDGGWAQLLGNWVHGRGEQWEERVNSWLPAGVDAWVVQRDVQDIAEYVSLWLTDSGEVTAPDYEERYDAWLSAFERAGVEGVGFGWVCLHDTGSADPVVRIEEWPHAVEQPLGPYVSSELAGARWLAGRSDDELLGARLRVPPDVRQEQIGAPGAEEDPDIIVLRQQTGMRRAERTGTELAALVGACDGTLTVGALMDAVASLRRREPAGMRMELLPEIRRLVEEGYLTP